MRRLIVLAALLMGCGLPLPDTPLPGPLHDAPTDTVRVYLVGMKVPGMYAAHADSIDVWTYQSATPRPARGLVVPLGLRRSTGQFVVYRTNWEEVSR